jgi:hypothetical protein
MRGFSFSEPASLFFVEWTMPEHTITRLLAPPAFGGPHIGDVTMISSLIERFFVLSDGLDVDKFVVFGSMAIPLNGIDLRRRISDMDLFVSERTFAELRQRYGEKRKRVMSKVIPVLAMGDKIEIMVYYPGVNFEQVNRNARPTRTSRGLKVATIADILKWKGTQRRKKDLRDLAVVNKALEIGTLQARV